MTTTHAFDREEVMAYLDGELSGAAAESARAHLDSCAECREMAAGFKRVTGQFGEWHVEPAPPELAGRVVPPSPTAPRLDWLTDWLRWPRVAVVGAMAIVLAVGVSVSRNSPPTSLDSAQAEKTVDDRDRALRQTYLAPAPAQAAVAVEPPPGSGLVGNAAQEAGLPTQPMIIRIVTLRVSTEKFDDARPTIERLLGEHAGRIGSLSISGEQNRRSLSATLRVPSARLDGLVAALRTLGHVQHEAINTEDVTSEYQDLSIRIATARREEQRLIALLTNRTGKLSDVLEVEREIARVRTEIERMDAALRTRKDQVDYSSINLVVAEAYRAELALAPTSLGARIRNAAIDGVRFATDGLIDVLLSIIQIVPSVLLWVLVLAWPARALLRRARAWNRA